MTYTGADGVVVARIHEPTNAGDNVLSRRAMIKTTLEKGVLATGIEPGPTALAMYATAPVRKDNRVVGTMDIGTSLTLDYFAKLKSKLRSELAVQIWRGGKFEKQTSTFGDMPGLGEAELKTILDGGAASRLIDHGGKAYIASGAPVKNFAGQTIGVLELAADVTDIMAARTRSLWTLAGVTLVICLLALAGFFLFARSIGSTIGRLSDTMRRLAAGDVSTEVPGQDRRDEIGAMARSVEVFKQGAIDRGRLEQRGRPEPEPRREQPKRPRGLARSGGPGAGARRVRSRGRPVEPRRRRPHLPATTPFPGEYRKLQDDFNAAIGRLQDTMQQIAQATDTIRNGTGEISGAADDLSRRTEQQAATLEETAAALDEITATVEQDGRGRARTRSAVVGPRASRMPSSPARSCAAPSTRWPASRDPPSRSPRSSASSTRSPSRPTCWRSMPASRRRGPAMRAGALRSSPRKCATLAQRSAEAAKEIKTLIQASTSQVSAGVDLVRSSRRRARAHRRAGGRDQRPGHRDRGLGAASRPIGLRRGQHGRQPDGPDDAAERRHGRAIDGRDATRSLRKPANSDACCRASRSARDR